MKFPEKFPVFTELKRQQKTARMDGRCDEDKQNFKPNHVMFVEVANYFERFHPVWISLMGFGGELEWQILPGLSEKV